MDSVTCITKRRTPKCRIGPYAFAFVLALLSFGAAGQAAAQVVTNRAFDLVLQDDDPVESFTFTLAPDPLVASVIRFDGFFQNLAPLQTVVRYDLWWSQPDGAFGGMLGLDWTPLPGSGQLPVHFEQSIPFTPASMVFHIEGGGPTDHFQFVGDLTVAQVPEPTVCALIATGMMLAWAGIGVRRLRRRAA